MDTMTIGYIVIAFVVGFLLALLFRRGPKREAEEAQARADTLNRSLKDRDGQITKLQSQTKDQQAQVAALTGDNTKLTDTLRTAEPGLTDASTQLEQLAQERTELQRALDICQSDRLLLETEVSQARAALVQAREQATTLSTELVAQTEDTERLAEAMVPVAMESDVLQSRVVELETDISIAQLAINRLTEQRAYVLTEMSERRRSYNRIIQRGPEAVVVALTERDNALLEAKGALDYARRDVGVLTNAGAELAAELNLRNAEYAVLLGQLAKISGKDAATYAGDVSQAAERSLATTGLVTAAEPGRPDLCRRKRSAGTGRDRAVEPAPRSPAGRTRCAQHGDG